MIDITRRVWLILALAIVVIIGLLIWAGTAGVMWLNAQTPVATEAGKRLASEAATKVEQFAPGLKERAEQWLPGVKAELEQRLPGLGENPPVREVSGTDIGPVPRYPGLVRSRFARSDQTVEVVYVGSAEFDSVLASYVQGFATAGYSDELMSASSDGEQRRFRRGEDSIDFSIARDPNGSVEVHLKQILPQ